MKTLFPRSVRGSTLVVIMVAILVGAMLVGISLNVTNFNGRLTNRSVERAKMIAYADGFLESLYDQWRNAVISVNNNTDRTLGLSNSSLASAITAPTNTELPLPQNISVVSWSVQAATPLLVALTDSAARPVAEGGTQSSMMTRLNYLASITLKSTSVGSNSTITVQRNFVRGGKSFFSYFYFGTQPMTEMHPGPPMYLTGTVYVGGNLYTSHDSLHFMQDVSFTGSHYLDFRPEDSRYGTEVPSITTGGLGDNWSLSNPPHVGQSQKLFDVPFASLDPNFRDDPISNDTNSDGNPNNDGFHEIVEEVNSSYSDVLQLDPALTERLVATADYRIYVNSANAVTIYKGASTTALLSTSADYIAISGALITNTALYDQRQGDNVRTVSLDVGAITTAYSAAKITDNNNNNDGLTFYIADTSYGTSVSTKLAGSSVTSSKSRAVKLINGAKLPYNSTTGTGFTVITPNPVYIQGDYNTGATVNGG